MRLMSFQLKGGNNFFFHYKEIQEEENLNNKQDSFVFSLHDKRKLFISECSDTYCVKS